MVALIHTQEWIPEYLQKLQFQNGVTETVLTLPLESIKTWTKCVKQWCSGHCISN